MIELNFAKRIYFSFISMLACCTLIAFAGIKGFQRLAPTIENINSRNTQSLYYAEQMLTSISTQKDLVHFEQSLESSKQNITEQHERDVIENIEESYRQAFSGNREAEHTTIKNIVKLTEINRKAMADAGARALQLERIGMWIIIFPTVFAWIIGITLLKLLNRNIINPLSELKSVISDYRRGNKMRRCPKITQSGEFKELYLDINAILDNS